VSASPLPPKSYPAGAELLGWMPLAAMVLIAANDAFRVSHPSWLTGKISDFAVLLYFPFLLSAAFALLLWVVDRVRLRVRRRAAPFHYRLTKRRLRGCLFLSGAGLAAVNLSAGLRDQYLALLRAVDVLHLFKDFRYTVDPTDLVALLALYPAWLWGRRFVAEDSPVSTTRRQG
jgi:hypothetical protein